MSWARAATSIDVPIAHAWAGLTDFASYSTWNPFITRVDGIEGPLGVGSKFCLHVAWSDGSGVVSSWERTTVFEPPTATADGVQRATFTYVACGQLDRFGLVRATRAHRLTQHPGGPTLYETEEKFTGAIAAFVPLKKVQQGFNAQTAAMKVQLESTR